MDIGKSFTFQFEDRRWASKLGLGILISLVPILNFALSGYLAHLVRNVMNGASETLPDWDGLGRKFTDGVILLAAGLVYALPVLVVVCLPLAMFGVSGLFSGNNDLQSVGRSIATAGGALLFCLACVFILYAILLSVIHPAITVMFAREGTFAACFKVRDVLKMVSSNAGPFFTAWIVYVVAVMGVGLVVGMLNVAIGWIPFFGWIVSGVLGLGSAVYLLTMYAHLFGQFGLVAFGQKPGDLSS